MPSPSEGYVGCHCGVSSREVAQRNSPMLCITPAAPAAAACEVLVAVAQHDSPEFRRQSQEYGQVSPWQRPVQLCGDAAPAGPSDVLSWDEQLLCRIRAVFLLLLKQTAAQGRMLALAKLWFLLPCLGRMGVRVPPASAALSAGIACSWLVCLPAGSRRRGSL